VKPSREKVGLWMIGAAGGIGSTVALGVAALRKGLAEPIGLVSALPQFEDADLVAPGAMVIGGHEVRAVTILEAIHESHDQDRLFDEKTIARCAPVIRSWQRNVRPGTVYGSSASLRAIGDITAPNRERSPAAVIERLRSDIASFARRHRLDRVVVVNVASSEPGVRPAAAHARYALLEKALAKPGAKVLPASSLYALAAIEAGAAYVNFTPSTGIALPAIQQRADQRGAAYMGSDGKTGETLLKSVLAPMFVMRNLRILSWYGQNILGNRDGAVLNDPRTRASKVKSKDGVISRIVGYKPMTHVGIDFVPSLGDWKVAWDFVHFAGFLNTPMHVQFIWQGSDSILAAPLVIDLARFTALEMRAGRGGPMRHLACFFKDPLGVDEQKHARQWRSLVEHVTGAKEQS
jgi:myo-inositol-1-phosphate synthase